MHASRHLSACARHTGTCKILNAVYVIEAQWHGSNAVWDSFTNTGNGQLHGLNCSWHGHTVVLRELNRRVIFQHLSCMAFSVCYLSMILILFQTTMTIHVPGKLHYQTSKMNDIMGRD